MAESKEGSTISRRKIIKVGLGVAGLTAVNAIFGPGRAGATETPTPTPSKTPTVTVTPGAKGVETRIADAKATGTAIAKEEELRQIEEQNKKLQEGSKGTPVPPTASPTTVNVEKAVKATMTAKADEEESVNKKVQDRVQVRAEDAAKETEAIRAKALGEKQASIMATATFEARPTEAPTQKTVAVGPTPTSPGGSRSGGNEGGSLLGNIAIIVATLGPVGVFIAALKSERARRVIEAPFRAIGGFFRRLRGGPPPAAPAGGGP